VHDEFAALHADTRERLASLAHEWAAGEWSANGFAEAMDRVLLDAHTAAVVIGRTHAGDDAPEEADDARFAAGIVEGEHEYLRGFVQDLDHRYTGEDGVRDGEAVAARAKDYVGRVTGTANEAWTLTLPEETPLWWRLSQPEESACTDCPELANASPWTPGDLVAHPGSNQTSCLQNCRCWLETASGQRGFVTP
jgi:hypothetical protein